MFFLASWVFHLLSLVIDRIDGETIESDFESVQVRAGVSRIPKILSEFEFHVLFVPGSSGPAEVQFQIIVKKFANNRSNLRKSSPSTRFFLDLMTFKLMQTRAGLVIRHLCV